MWRMWWPSTAMFAVAVALLVTGVLGTGAFDTASILLIAVLLGLASISSPLFFPRHTDDATARREAAEQHVPVVYWRPGCVFCIKLRIRLHRHADRAVWVNIWRDPVAAQRVREVNDGNETVPTVFVGTDARTNPDPRWVRAQLP